MICSSTLINITLKSNHANGVMKLELRNRHSIINKINTTNFFFLKFLVRHGIILKSWCMMMLIYKYYAVLLNMTSLLDLTKCHKCEVMQSLVCVPLPTPSSSDCNPRPVCVWLISQHFQRYVDSSQFLNKFWQICRVYTNQIWRPLKNAYAWSW